MCAVARANTEEECAWRTSQVSGVPIKDELCTPLVQVRLLAASLLCTLPKRLQPKKDTSHRVRREYAGTLSASPNE